MKMIKKINLLEKKREQVSKLQWHTTTYPLKWCTWKRMTQQFYPECGEIKTSHDGG